jgi:hypothetical protein
MMVLSLNHIVQSEVRSCTDLDGAWRARVAIKQTAGVLFERNQRISNRSRDELAKNDRIYSSYLQYMLTENIEFVPCEIDDPIVRLADTLFSLQSSETGAYDLIDILVNPDFDLEALYDLETIIGKDKPLHESWIDKFGSLPIQHALDLITKRHESRSRDALIIFVRLLRESDGYFAQETYDTLGKSLIENPEWYLENDTISREFLLDEARLETLISHRSVEINDLADVFQKHLEYSLAKDIVELLDSLR